MDEPNSITQIVIAGSAAVLAALFGLQKLATNWKSSSTESSIMTIMHTELERMATHNATLATELNKLQIEIVTLNQELRKLTVENQQLHSEVAALTAEVTRLQIIVSQDRRERNGLTSKTQL